MAVLNVTPDSFSDGGELGTLERVVERAREAVEAGAAVLDIGGESTRPGAERVAAEEQIGRVVPAVTAIREAGMTVPITVDTTLRGVAEAALDAGADAINDVSAGEESSGGTVALAAERGCGICLMHRLRAPDADKYSDRYDERGRPDYGERGDDGGGDDGGEGEDAVVRAVRAALLGAASRAEAAGVVHERVCLDVGLGFGKTVEQNVALMRAAGVFVSLGYPVLFGASRKSFIGALSGVEDPGRRVSGSVGAAVSMAERGARLLRVHDVRAHAEALAVSWAITNDERPVRHT